MAWHGRIQKSHGKVKITLVDMNKAVYERQPAMLADLVRLTLREKGITVRNSATAQRVTAESITLSDESVIKCDLVVWATGASAPPFLKANTDLKTVCVCVHLCVFVHVCMVVYGYVICECGV